MMCKIGGFTKIASMTVTAVFAAMGCTSAQEPAAMPQITMGNGEANFIVFVADAINVEDRAVFEGSQMIAHFISLP